MNGINYVPVTNKNSIYHRDGWKYCIEILTKLNNPQSSIKLIDLVEDYYLIHNKCLRYDNNQKWIGILHHPPNVVDSKLDKLLTHSNFQNDLQHCIGLWTLSKYLANYLKKKLNNIPIYNTFHPVKFDFQKFSLDLFSKNKSKHIVFIGNQDRIYSTFYNLDIPGYTKVWLSGKSFYLSLDLMYFELKKNKPLSRNDITKRISIKNVSCYEYDKIFTNNLIIVELYDSSANNAVLECISRSTPIFVNNVGGVSEYLGTQYPLYYDSLDVLKSKIVDHNLICKAHQYLSKMDKSFLKSDYFVDSFIKNIAKLKILLPIKPNIQYDNRVIENVKRENSKLKKNNVLSANLNNRMLHIS